LRCLSDDLFFNQSMAQLESENQATYRHMANIYQQTINNLEPWVILHDIKMVRRYGNDTANL
jgi:hypothetical protein